LKNPVTSPGIEPTMFWHFITQTSIWMTVYLATKTDKISQMTWKKVSCHVKIMEEAHFTSDCILDDVNE
jgi:GTP-binding protein EngB required for normal cell division